MCGLARGGVAFNQPDTGTELSQIQNETSQSLWFSSVSHSVMSLDSSLCSGGVLEEVECATEKSDLLPTSALSSKANISGYLADLSSLSIRCVFLLRL